MPEIDREKLSAKLDAIPEADREGYVQALRASGYTWKSSAPAQQDTSIPTPGISPEAQVPGMFPYEEEKKIWDQANAQGLDYYQAKQKVLEARKKYTQSQKLGGIGENISGASGIVAGTALAPLGLAKKGIEYAGQEVQKKYPGMAGTLAGKALSFGASGIPSSPLQIAGQEGAGLAVGAAMPAVRAVGGKVGQALEGLSGLEYKTPGVLAEAAADPSLLFGPGKKAAGLAYEAIKDDLQIRPAMLTATSAGKIVDNAIYALEQGDLTPQEALVARRALDDKFGAIPATTANYLRPKFDAIAKTITADADSAFKKAIKSEALRTILATNKGGGTSIAKFFLGGLTGGALNVASSPIVQATLATGAGLGARAVESAPASLRGATLAALRAQRNQ